MRIPSMSRSRYSVKSRSSSSDVESNGSRPEIAFAVSAQSATVLAMGPIWSSDDPNAMRPYRLTVP